MKNFIFSTFLIVSSISTAYSSNQPNTSSDITLSDIKNHQDKWCKSLINISEVYSSKGISEAKKLASKMIDEQYTTTDGELLFKPTLSEAPQTFRTTKEGALAYFVGDNANFPNDKGFAIKGWKKCEINNFVIKNFGKTALVMGKTHLVDKYGKNTDVDKTWGFVKESSGNLKVFLHHSSLEYSSKK